MNTTHKVFKKLRRDRFGVRISCLSFLLIGGVLFTMSLLSWLDPEATIVVNNEPTNSPTAKLQAIILTSFSTLVGLVGLMLPKRLLNRILIARASLFSSTGESLTQKQYRWFCDYPVAVSGFFALFMLVATGGNMIEKIASGNSISSLLPEFLIIVGIGTAFFYFFFRFAIWMSLKFSGQSLRVDR